MNSSVNTIWLLGALFFAGRAESAEVQILVDGSGSMRGYVQTEALANLVERYAQRVEVSANTSSSIDAFVTGSSGTTTLVSFEHWVSSPSYGYHTDLEAALGKRDEDTRLLVMLTDNVHDPLGSGNSPETDDFYAALQHLPVTRTWLVLHLVEFDGPVEVPKVPGLPSQQTALRELIERDTPPSQGVVSKLSERTRYWRAVYSGNRALAAYVFAFSETAAVVGEELVEALDGPGDRPLRIKPMEQNTLKLTQAKEFRPDPSAMRCQTGKPRDPVSTNLTLVHDDTGLRLTPAEGFRYEPALPVTLGVNIRYSSNEDHIQVGELGGLDVDCDRLARVSIENLRIHVPDELMGVLTAEAREAWVSPNVISGDLSAAEGASSAQVAIHVPPLVGPDVPAFIVGDDIQLSADLSVVVPGESFRLDSDIWGTYFTDKTTDLTRLYSPADPVSQLASRQVTLQIPLLVPSFSPPCDGPEGPPCSPERSSFLGFLLGGAALLALLLAWYILQPLGLKVQLQSRRSDGGWHTHHPLMVGGISARGEVPLRAKNGVMVSVRRAVSLRSTLVLSVEGGEPTRVRRGGTAIIGDEGENAVELRWPR